MEALEKRPESKSKIRFPDCDPFNHLNNSKYIDYFLNAREDQLLSYYEFDLAKFAQEKGIAWLVTQNQIAYFKPATLMETVVIQTHLFYYDERELKLEATMWNEEKTVLKSVLWAKFTHFNLVSKKSAVHSTELLAWFKEIADPLFNGISFEERVLQLKQR